MAGIGPKWGNTMRLIGIALVGFLLVFSVLVSAQETSQQKTSSEKNSSQSVDRSGYKHVWPEMKFGWRIIVGGIIGFLGAAFGSVGGVGGGGIFVPMLTLVMGFDEKSSTAISKCMVAAGAASTVFYNLRQRHPTLDLPIIDYDLTLLFQPMLMLGISLGVACNVIFADWMIILLMIIVFLATSTKSFLKGIQTWKKETIVKKEAALRLQANGNNNEAVEYNNNHTVNQNKDCKRKENYTTKCSVLYWLLNFLQIPVTVGVTAYEAVGLYKGRKVIASKGVVATVWSVRRLLICCAFGMLAGMVGGLLGLGGGFIMGPLFLELGVPPQVSSATATLVMVFSSSNAVVEYYLLKRFPVPYAVYFAGVAAFSAIVGQRVVGKVISLIGRASLIIFILSSMIFVSAITLGGVGIANAVEKIHNHEYMGFENICKS
ncbi:sulfite exporter TauE/SafE family protein 3 [Morus notabilis]|uniref:sulfite exporter TauE/SafE family protein 3 n=1 Tax=Morus notabilis TaxID=981085 RepID=UPI000CED2388|nr:sulfite exporter TauE/SafE family protein 3 [Morus notabilis]